MHRSENYFYEAAGLFFEPAHKNNFSAMEGALPHTRGRGLIPHTRGGGTPPDIAGISGIFGAKADEPKGSLRHASAPEWQPSVAILALPGEGSFGFISPRSPNPGNGGKLRIRFWDHQENNSVLK